MKRLTNHFRGAVLVLLGLGLSGFGPGSCGPLPEPCEALDEQGCLTTEGCAPVYAEPLCACSPCAEEYDCPPCDCGVPAFVTCEEERPQPPPPSRCVGLDERSCIAVQGCVPLYYQADPDARCEADGRCLGGYAGCTEGEPPPPPPPPLPCERLDEPACLSRPDCAPSYDRCGPEERCGGGFAGCTTVCPAVACEMWCPDGFARDARGCEVCRCAEPGCLSDADCARGERCVFEAMPDDPTSLPPEPMPGVCVADPVCEPVACDLWCPGGFEVDERGCEVCACNPGCLSDRDCAEGERCMLPDCPPGADCAGAGVCVADPVCEPVMCDLWCPNGFAVDERGCEVCACKPGCLSDADCGAGERCEIGLTNCDAAGNCWPQEGACVPATCTADGDCRGGERCLFRVEACPPGEPGCPLEGLCAPEGACLSDGDCAAGQSCMFLLYDCLGEDCGPGWGTCTGEQPGCFSDADCAAGERCEPMDCADGTDCGGGGSCVPAGCASDEDCGPGQVCELYDTCTALGCPPPGGFCREAGCEGLDERACLEQPLCAATYEPAPSGSGMVFRGCVGI